MQYGTSEVNFLAVWTATMIISAYDWKALESSVRAKNQCIIESLAWNLQNRIPPNRHNGIIQRSLPHLRQSNSFDRFDSTSQTRTAAIGSGEARERREGTPY